MTTKIPRVLLVVLALAAASCGYHLSGRGSSLPPHVKTIAVPTFGNSTTRPELGQRVTEKLVQQIVARGKYKVVSDAQGADAVLSGTVNGWTSRPVSTTANQSEAKRVSVTLRAQVKFEDLVDHRVTWEQDDYNFTAEYDVVGDAETYFDTELGAVEKVAEDFSRAVVSAVFQGF